MSMSDIARKMKSAMAFSRADAPSRPSGAALMWNGSALVAPPGADGPMETIAQWDGARNKARWTGKRRPYARVHVVLDEAISYACMSPPPVGATTDAREGQLRFGLANQSDCTMPMEDALATSLPGEGNKRHESDILFAASRINLARLASAAKDLGLTIKSAQPFASALARGALEISGLSSTPGPAGVFVPGKDGSWLLVFRAGELQWLFAFHWGRDRWASAPEQLLEAIENFNDRESNLVMESLAIIHGSDDDWSASVVANQMEGALAGNSYFNVPTVRVDCAGEDLPRWLAIRGASHAHR